MTKDYTKSILEGIETLQKKYPTSVKQESPSGFTIASLLSALNEFMECVRYLNTRRSSGAILNLNNEADVQDTLFIMMRPWIHDLTPENPTDKIANCYSIKDFLIKSLRTVIEVKYVRNADHGKYLVKELNNDIETYRYHACCDHLIFFIYDPNAHIPDVASLIGHVSESRIYKGKVLKCYAVVKP